MTDTKKEAGTLLPMIVTEGVTVSVLPSERYEYLMTTNEVAVGYGTSKYAVQKTLLRHGEELIEGKHYVIGVDNLSTRLKIPHNAVLWTKRGIVRLGFFIKSERAKLFRDWAEELVINRLDRQLTLFEQPAKALPAKRNHNRLTNDRLLDIMADVCRIEDSNLRLSIASKLMKGGAL
jgi:hypothetical protein